MDDLFFENSWLYFLLVIWIGGIFYLSSSKGSVSRTFPYFARVLRFLLPGSDEVILRTDYLVVRKLGHFFGYGILALLASGIFYSSSMPFLAKFWYLFAFVIVLVVAALDEARQSFYEDRVGSLSDVALDGVGGLTAILLFWIFTLSFFR